MKKQIISFVVASYILFVGSAFAGTPNCSNLKGNWVNQLGSTLSIVTIDSTTNAITGTYQSPSGTSGQKFALSGWINHLKPKPKQDNAQVISFSVQWGTYGSITSWTGYCKEQAGKPTIKTLWHLVSSNSQYTWDHILTNSDIFTPKEDH